MRRTIMATFIMLGSYTDQGIRNVKDTTKRADAFKEMAKKSGVTVRDVYWTLGQYDVVAIYDAPDDETASAVGYRLGALGNVRTHTLRAFSSTEMTTILSKMT
jgi:uncharacterized protein with GYD domain